MRASLTLAITIAALLGSGTPAHADATAGKYVALGDSYAAVGDLTEQYGTPGCFRSLRNYANGVAAVIHPRQFVDETCGDARTENMTVPQAVAVGVNPAQFDGLSTDTDLVTVSIGGNNLNLPATLGPCIALAATDLSGDPWERYYNSGGFDKLRLRIDTEIGPAVEAVLQGIHQRAPHARVAVVDYLAPLPVSGGCFPTAPFAAGDVAYLTRTLRHFAEVVMDRARQAGDIGVDVNAIAGHDMCRPEGTRWVEPLVPGAPTTPFHPNAAGSRAVAAAVLGALGRSAG